MKRYELAEKITGHVNIGTGRDESYQTITSRLETLKLVYFAIDKEIFEIVYMPYGHSAEFEGQTMTLSSIDLKTDKIYLDGDREELKEWFLRNIQKTIQELTALSEWFDEEV